MISISKIQVNQFFSVCLQLVQQTNYIIKNIHEKNELKEIKKELDHGVQDYVTEADLQAQELIIGGINHFWPDLKIVAEETLLPKTSIKMDYNKINLNLIPQEIFQPKIEYQQMINEYDINDACVWIDPLDGTLSFLDNDLQAVTTLIGLSIKEKPTLGIISQPYQQSEKCQFEFIPKIYFSHAIFPKIFYVYHEDIDKEKCIPWELQKFDHSKHQNRLILCGSKHHSSKKQIENMNLLNPTQIISFGGAGNKILTVIKGQSDAYFYEKSGTKRWDTCAGEALLKSIGGYLTDLQGNQYDYIYSQNEDQILNKNGIIVCGSKQKYQNILKNSKIIFNQKL